MNGGPPTPRDPRFVLFNTVPAHPEIIHSNIVGTIPKWINGSLLKVGPAKFEQGEEKYNHLFDGMALLHRFNISNGQVEYHSKFLESWQAGGRHSLKSFDVTGGLHDFSYFTYFIPFFFTDNDNINFLTCGDEIYSTSETGILHKINQDSLETESRVKEFYYTAVNTTTAHPHYDTDGNMYNIGSRFVPPASYSVIKVPPVYGRHSEPCAFKKAEVVARIPIEHYFQPRYYHSFGMTDNYFVFLEQPLAISLLKLAFRKFQGLSLVDTLQWQDGENCRIHVVSRNTGEPLPTHYQCPPMFCFHHINAYEQDNHLVVDMCCYDDTKIIQDFLFKNLLNKDYRIGTSLAEGRRLILPLNCSTNEIQSESNLVTLTGSMATAVKTENGTVMCQWQVISPRGLELPRINYEKYNGKNYQYFYATSGTMYGGYKNSLLKVEVNTGNVTQWKGDVNQYPSEPVFIPHPDGELEDDGVVVALVCDVGDDEPDFLLLLDAKSFTELARAEVGQVRTMGIHAAFVNRT